MLLVGRSRARHRSVKYIQALQQDPTYDDRSHWVPDNSANVCSDCSAHFTALRRRYERLCLDHSCGCVEAGRPGADLAHSLRERVHVRRGPQAPLPDLRAAFLQQVRVDAVDVGAFRSACGCRVPRLVRCVPVGPFDVQPQACRTPLGAARGSCDDAAADDLDGGRASSATTALHSRTTTASASRRRRRRA